MVGFYAGEGRSVSAAAFDGGTGRIIAVTPNDSYSDIEVAGFDAARGTRKWTTKIAAVPTVPGNTLFTSSHADSVVVSSEHHVAYVGGSYFYRTPHASVSASYLYALDTRTGKELWRHIDAPIPGMYGGYYRLAEGPDGSVVAVRNRLLYGLINYPSSYGVEVTSFSRAGLVEWRWADTNRGHITDAVVTRKGAVVLVGGAYDDTWWSDGYRIALDARGLLKWRAISDGTRFNSLAVDREGRVAYVAGDENTDGGVRSITKALDVESGRLRWTRVFGRVIRPITRYSATDVVVARNGPCVTGSREILDRRLREVVPTNGFIACYSEAGRLRWIRRALGGAGVLLKVEGGRLLWAGRREEDHPYYLGPQVLRYEIRSLRDGRLHHSKQDWSLVGQPGRPLFIVAHRGVFHFVTTDEDRRLLWSQIFHRS
jgi:outer membrane protein assembly factor BamB